jgi:hypothetical protein
MKLKTILAGALALGFTSSAMAQTTTEITITGATAFRQATMQSIFNAYNSIGGGLGNNFNVAHDFPATGSNNLSQLIASNRAIFVGTFPGIEGTTIIRTSFNGSTEGLNAIAGNNDPSFFQVATLPAGITASYQTQTPAGTFENLRPKFSFSDVYQSTSPVDNEVLNPVGASAVGVVTFAMVANEGAPANWNNATIQQCRALWQQGVQPLSLFTGNTNDTTLVLATGRNDGSGTRSAYLTEWTYGVANAVQQFVAIAGGTTATDITGLTLVPIGANLTNTNVPFRTGRASDASTLWGNTAVGNGGYSSSSGLRDLMGLVSTNVTLYDGSSSTPLATNAPVHLLTWLSTADSANAASAGAKILAFNGELVTPLARTNPANFRSSGFNEADFNKIAKGAYSAWSYQHLYYSGSLNAGETAWYNAMKSTWIPQGLQQTANGLRLEDMQVTRPDDGFPIVAPLL